MALILVPRLIGRQDWKSKVMGRGPQGMIEGTRALAGHTGMCLLPLHLHVSQLPAWFLPRLAPFSLSWLPGAAQGECPCARSSAQERSSPCSQTLQGVCDQPRLGNTQGRLQPGPSSPKALQGWAAFPR